MPIGFGAEAHNAKGTSDTGTLTITLNVPAGLQSAHVDVAIRMIGASPQSLTSLTYGGSGITFRSPKHESVSDNFNTVEHWYLTLGNNPTSGNISIVATPSAACRMIGNAVIRSGVHQTTPFPAVDSFANDAAPGTTITQTISSATGELVCDFVAPSGGNTLAAGGGQTERTNYLPGDSIGSSEEAGAASVVMSWTIGGTDNWLSLAWRLSPASTDPSVGLNFNVLRPAIFMPGIAR